MNKASEWAEHLRHARNAASEASDRAQAIEKSRPVSESFYASKLGQVHFSISDDGYPVLCVGDTKYPINFAEDISKLLASANWLILSFGDLRVFQEPYDR